MNKQDLIKAGAKCIGEMDFKNPLFQEAYGGTMTYWYLNGEVYESTYHANSMTYTGTNGTSYIGCFGDLYENELQRNSELLPEFQDNRFLDLLQKFVIKDAVNTEMSPHNHDDNLEDYADYKEFSLSNMQQESYIQYLIDTYDLPKNEAVDLHGKIIKEMKQQLDEKIMTVYAVWGVPGHDNNPIFTTIEPDSESIYDKLTVRLPKDFTKYGNAFGSICIENEVTGTKYTAHELLDRRGVHPVFHWHDGQRNHWRMLTVLDGPAQYKHKSQRRHSTVMKIENLNPVVIKR